MYSTAPPPIPFQQDNIKIMYHPHCGKPDEIFHLEDYNSSLPQPTNILIEENPWRPFRTCINFEIVELIFDTHMNGGQTTNFLKLLRKIAADPMMRRSFFHLRKTPLTDNSIFHQRSTDHRHYSNLPTTIDTTS